MRLSTSTNILCADAGVNYAISMMDSVRGCAAAGYRFLDANLCALCREGQPFFEDGWLEYAREVRELADSLGVTFTQAHAYFPIGRKFDVSGERTDRSFGEEMMRRSVLSAQILGVPWMVVHPLTMENESGYSYRKSFQYNREYYKRWTEFSASHRVGLAVENMSLFDGKMHYCATAEELLELVDSIGNPMAGICVDTGHAHLAKQDVPNFLYQVHERLRATHIADNSQTGDDHVAPFAGTIDWSRVMRAFKEINYRGDFSFEIQNLTGIYPGAVQQELVAFSFQLGQYLMGKEMLET